MFPAKTARRLPVHPSAPMPTAPTYLPTGDVAARKGCTAQAVRDAIERGDLNAVMIARTWAVADDAALAAWTVKETGGRAHRQREGQQPAER